MKLRYHRLSLGPIEVAIKDVLMLFELVVDFWPFVACPMFIIVLLHNYITATIVLNRCFTSLHHRQGGDKTLEQ